MTASAWTPDELPRRRAPCDVEAAIAAMAKTISRISQRWAFAAKRCLRSARWRGCTLPAARATARRMASASKAAMSSRPAPAGFRARGQSGTRVEVRELFFATPARLKFLKSARSEDLATADVVKRLAMARPDVHFTLALDGRRVARPRGRRRSVRRSAEASRAHHGPRFRGECASRRGGARRRAASRDLRAFRPINRAQLRRCSFCS